MRDDYDFTNGTRGAVSPGNIGGKKYKFTIKYKCPVLHTESTTVVYADDEDEALKISSKSRSSVTNIEKQNAPAAKETGDYS